MQWPCFELHYREAPTELLEIVRAPSWPRSLSSSFLQIHHRKLYRAVLRNSMECGGRVCDKGTAARTRATAPADVILSAPWNVTAVSCDLLDAGDCNILRGSGRAELLSGPVLAVIACPLHLRGPAELQLPAVTSSILPAVTCYVASGARSSCRTWCSSPLLAYFSCTVP